MVRHWESLSIAFSTASAGKAPILVLGMLLAFHSSAQVVYKNPIRTVNVRTVLARDTAETKVNLLDLNQANGRWAVLLGPRVGTKSSVVTGDATSEKAFSVEGKFDNFIMDENSSIHLHQTSRLRKGEPTNPASVVVVTPDGLKANTYQIPGGASTPLHTGSEVVWQTSEGFFGVGGGRTSLIRDSDTVKLISHPEFRAQRLTSGMLPSGKTYLFSDLAEDLVILDPLQKTTINVPLQLDSAFAAIGITPGRRDPSSGRSRIMWATTASDGKLVVCLSDTPMSGPAYVAVFNPETGALVEVIRANLPTSPARRGPNNANGVMVPSLGAMTDRLVLLDDSEGTLAFY